ncbi:MAG: hypothetical protein ABMA64_16955 [Myxococcota bacterium]
MKASILALVAAACSGGSSDSHSGTPSDDWQLRSHIDEGQLCIETRGADVAVFVVLDDCLSGSCSRGLVGTCEASLVNDATVQVTSSITWEDNVGPGVDCSSDCGIPMATCTLPGVPEGTYTFELGADSLEVTLPTTQPCLFL